MVRVLQVERISHAARALIDRPLDADVVVLESADALTPFKGAIDTLCANSVDSNPLFEAATLAAAMTHLQGKTPAHVALIWHKGDRGAPRELIGLFPFFTPRFYLGLPLRILSIWTHIHSFLVTPIVREGFELDAIRLFLDFANQSGASMVRFPLFQADGAFGPALAEVVLERELPMVETDRHERAFLKADMDSESYLAANMRKKKRKEYNRQWNRLSETGELKFEAPETTFDLTRWLQDFLQLERSGWKGKRGTALAERENEHAFFESMCRSAYDAGKFHAAQITLDGAPIAMLASFVSGRGAYSFKIQLAKILKAQGLNVMSFTGFTLEELHSPYAPKGSQDLLDELDLLIDGPFVESLAIHSPDSLVSSRNQKVRVFNPEFADKLTWASDQIEIHVLKDGRRIVTGFLGQMNLGE